jgi:polar amino acid transport system substrate-binding protein
MLKKLAIASLSLLLIVAGSMPSWAETVIERVRQTGILKAGVRKDAIPFSYLKDQQWKGYSLDLVKLIQQQIEKELNKSIQVEFVEFTVEDRIPKVVKEDVDIICGSTSFTWHRARFVDFSIPFFLTGTQLLVRKGSGLSSPESFKEKRIGVIPKTTNELIVMQKQTQSILVPVKDGIEGLAALKEKKIDAFAWDGILLEQLKQSLSNPEDFAIVPAQPYDRQGYACIIPPNNSQLLYLVNYALVNFMQGVLNNESQSVTLFNRWFGPQGVMPINQTFILDHFRDVVESHEKIPRDNL